MKKLKLDLALALPDEANACDACVAKTLALLRERRGVEGAHVDTTSGKPRLCLHYDPALVTVAAVERTARRAGAEVSSTYRHDVLHVEGMDCSDCVVVIEHTLRRLPGVLAASVSYAGGTVRVEYDSTKTSRAAIAARLDRVGYRVPKEGALAFVEEHRELLRSGACGLLAGVAWGTGRFLGAGPWVTAPLFGLSYLLGGWDVARHAVRSLRLLRADTDVLMIAAALGAASLGEYAEGALLLFLFSLGHALQDLVLDRARTAIRKLGELAPKTALVRRDGAEVEVGVERLALGDTVVVRPGARIPVDGSITGGSSTVNQAPVTGESVPVAKAPGDKVFAGTVNGEGALEVAVTRLSKDNTLARVSLMVEEAQAQKGRTQQVTERFTTWFVPLVLLIDIGAMLVPMAFGVSFREAFLRAMTLLVAASPCALALGAPAAMLAAVAQAARNGVLVKGGVHLEELGRIQVVAFDKTGTLTLGRPEVTDVVALNPEKMNGDEVLALTAAVERRSAHPVAEAILRMADQRELRVPTAGEVVSLTGRGLRSTVGGREMLVGNRRLFAETGLAVSDLAQARSAALEADGKTTMLVAVDREVVGLVGVADTPRPGAAEAVRRLRGVGIRRTVLLSGDNARVAEKVARDLGVDGAQGELMPEDKVAAIRRLRSGQAVAMVGDGVNDAPALAAADVGIAMGGAGTDVALEVADVALMGDDLTKLPFAIALGRATRRVVIQNLTISLVVIASLVVAAIGGFAGIGSAIVLHEGSTLLVALNAMRLLGFHGERE